MFNTQGASNAQTTQEVPPFKFPSIKSMLTARKGGVVILNILLALCGVQFIFGALHQLQIIQHITYTLLPLRGIILMSWLYFLYYNFKSKASKIMIAIDFMVCLSISGLINVVYNKIVRQCSSTYGNSCIGDPQFTFFTAWLFLLSPLGLLSTSPSSIFSIFKVAFDPGVLSVQKVLAIMFGFHWGLFLDDYVDRETLSFNPAWLYGCSILLSTYVISYKKQDKESNDRLFSDIINACPGFIYFLLPEEYHFLAFIPHLFMITKMMYEELKKINQPPEPINPFQSMLTSFLTNLSTGADPVQSAFGAVIGNPNAGGNPNMNPMASMFSAMSGVSPAGGVNPMANMFSAMASGQHGVNPMADMLSAMTGGPDGTGPNPMADMLSAMENMNGGGMNPMFPFGPPIQRNALLNVSNEECLHCGKRGARHKCSQCQQVYYCNRKCQKEDWSNHQEDCEHELD
ncbi:hypothetical protein AKO1_011144 [Acrasis kona]|uniref:MYND-type domain-containing protein n=1 Tax=Acrasis kona TaxID=1008807 RepID=A0AAW2YYJ1_9EUKA